MTLGLKSGTSWVRQSHGSVSSPGVRCTNIPGSPPSKHPVVGVEPNRTAAILTPFEGSSLRRLTVTHPHQFRNPSEGVSKHPCPATGGRLSCNSFWLIPGWSPKSVVLRGPRFCSLGSSFLPIILSGHKKRTAENTPALRAEQLSQPASSWENSGAKALSGPALTQAAAALHHSAPTPSTGFVFI